MKTIYCQRNYHGRLVRQCPYGENNGTAMVGSAYCTGDCKYYSGGNLGETVTCAHEDMQKESNQIMIKIKEFKYLGHTKFTWSSEMEELIPQDRIITVEKDAGDYWWKPTHHIYLISDDMIEKFIEPSESIYDSRQHIAISKQIFAKMQASLPHNDIGRFATYADMAKIISKSSKKSTRSPKKRTYNLNY